MSDIRRFGVLFACALLAAFGCSKHKESEPPAAQAPQPVSTSGAERNYQAPTAPPVEEPAPAATTPAEAERAPAPEETVAAPIGDAQSVRILSTVDNGEIEQAHVAQSKTKDPRVKKFAAQMIDQHTKAEQKNQQLQKKEQLLPSNSSLANDLTDQGSRVLDSLNRVEGPEFDKTYIDAQVDQHQAVLDLLELRPIPNAENPKLKAQLEEVKKMVEQHLEHAKKIQAQTQR